MSEQDAAWLECIADYSDFVLYLIEQKGDVEAAKRVLRSRLAPRPKHTITYEDMVEAVADVMDLHDKNSVVKQQALTINVNGKDHIINRASISYEEVLSIAGVSDGASCTYHGKTHGDSSRSGILYKGGRAITIEDGMIFNVHNTWNA